MSHRGNGFTGLGTALVGACGGAAANLVRRRELMLRSGGRVRYVALPVSLQIAALVLLAAAGWWVARTTYISLGYHTIIAGKDGEIERMARANEQLLDTIAKLRSRYSDVADTLTRNQHEIAGLMKQKASLQHDLGQLRAGIGRANDARVASAAKQVELRKQVGQLETRLAACRRDVRWGPDEPLACHRDILGSDLYPGENRQAGDRSWIHYSRQHCRTIRFQGV